MSCCRKTARRQTGPPGRHRGSISLEAVLVLPFLLLITWFMLSQIIAVTARIKLSGALHRTAAELSLLGPAACLIDQARQSGVRSDGTEGGPDLAAVDAVLDLLCPGTSAEQLLFDAVLDIGSTGLVGPAVLSRIGYWLDDAAAGQPGFSGSSRSLWRGSIRDLRIFLDWQTDRRQLWLCLSWEQLHALGRSRRTLQAVVPLWTGQADRADEGSQADAVWLLDNFTRGQAFRERLGATLPYDFPVIASFTDGTATAFKSMDLTAPTYAEQNAFQNQVAAFVETVAAFSGADYDKGGRHYSISAGEITGRRLVLVIPQNSSRHWLDTSLADLGTLAAGSGVDLEVVRSGVSTRYAPGIPDNG